MDNKSPIVAYQAKIIKCPSCHLLIDYEGHSKVSKNNAIKDLLEKMESHLKERCFCRKASRKKVKHPISIMTTTNNQNITKYSWDENNFIII